MTYKDKGSYQSSPPCNHHFIFVLWDVTHSHVGHDSCICVTWLIKIINVWHDSFIMRTSSFLFCGIWRLHQWNMTHPYVGHDSFICVTWLVHTWDMTHSPCNLRRLCPVGHDSSICGTWLTHTQDTTQFYKCYETQLILVWHDSCWLICEMSQHESCHTRMSCVSEHI